MTTRDKLIAAGIIKPGEPRPQTPKPAVVLILADPRARGVRLMERRKAAKAS